MNKKSLSNLLVLSGILLAGGSALAQPQDPYAPAKPPDKAPTPAQATDDEPPPSSKLDVEEEVQPPTPEPFVAPMPNAPLAAQPRPTGNESKSYAKRKAASFPEMRAPQLLSVPTAHLLPAAIVYSTASVDTGGSIGGSLRVGLGDVGEFGLETSPLIRMISFPGATPDTIQPLIFATFKMGVAEDHLFENQPALALGFRKSFNREYEGNDIRAAAIELTASKSFGKVSVHGGGVFWDAEMEEDGGETVALHDDALGIKRQIRPFGGVVAEPFEDSHLIVDVAWVPLFRPGEARKADRLELRPSLSWGIRYILSDAVSLESGVRVPDIGEANLLDAQIFGQFTFASDKIRRGLGMK